MLHGRADAKAFSVDQSSKDESSDNNLAQKLLLPCTAVPSCSIVPECAGPKTGGILTASKLGHSKRDISCCRRVPRSCDVPGAVPIAPIEEVTRQLGFEYGSPSSTRHPRAGVAKVS